MARQKEEQYAEDEAQRRVEKALRAAFSTPHKTYEESKVGKRTKPQLKRKRRQRAS
jgi:hypothetical protein